LSRMGLGSTTTVRTGRICTDGFSGLHPARTNRRARRILQDRTTMLREGMLDVDIAHIAA
jgi:hypothetical protein